jgi:hypothetical protein
MRSLILCGCSKRLLNSADCTYVFRFRPYCKKSCFDRAVANDDRKNHKRAEAYALSVRLASKEECDAAS